jgi:FkbM family methyltransferase
VSEWIVRFLKEDSWGCRNRDVWDIGAHFGITSLLCAAHTSNRVVSFEISQANIDEMRLHLQANSRFAGKIEIFCAAVSDADGLTEMLLSRSPCENQIVHPSVKVSSRNQTSHLTSNQVRTMRLDSFIAAGAEYPGLINIDIEGAEALALSGAERLLRIGKPIVIVEVHNREASAESVRLLRAADYEIWYFKAGRLCLMGGETLTYGHVLAVPEGRLSHRRLQGLSLLVRTGEAHRVA